VHARPSRAGARRLALLALTEPDGNVNAAAPAAAAPGGAAG
jgi:hypothetical protein